MILLSKVLCKKQGKEEQEEDDELLAGVLGGVLDLLKVHNKPDIPFTGYQALVLHCIPDISGEVLSIQGTQLNGYTIYRILSLSAAL